MMATTDLPSAGQNELTKLNDHLDAVWIEYLALLDTYTKAQSAIQQSFSAGFFSLAQANARASAGRRFGQDWYDGRMKATRRVRFESPSAENDSDGRSRVQSLRIFSTDDEGYVFKKDEQSPVSTKKEAIQQPSPPATPEPESQPTDGPDAAANETKASAQKSSTTPTDPLRWFGILVPPELKRAQKAFSTVVEERATAEAKTPDQQGDAEAERDEEEPGPVVKSVRAAGRMRELEVEIRKLRKSLRKLEKSVVESA